MAARRFQSRTSVVLAFFIALSGACGGGDDDGETPAEYETKPGPSVPEPPAQRLEAGEGEVLITPSGAGQPITAELLAKVEGTTTIYEGRESGYRLVMECGDTIADVDITLHFTQGQGIDLIERKGGRWTIGPDKRAAEIVTTQPTSDAGDAGDDAQAPEPATDLVDGVGLPAPDGSREVVVSLLSSGVRYDIRVTIPWLASSAPATCQVEKPGTGTKGSSGGCGSGSKSKSRRSSGGDWD